MGAGRKAGTVGWGGGGPASAPAPTWDPLVLGPALAMDSRPGTAGRGGGGMEIQSGHRCEDRAAGTAPTPGGAGCLGTAPATRGVPCPERDQGRGKLGHAVPATPCTPAPHVMPSISAHHPFRTPVQCIVRHAARTVKRELRETSGREAAPPTGVLVLEVLVGEGAAWAVRGAVQGGR